MSFWLGFAAGAIAFALLTVLFCAGPSIICWIVAIVDDRRTECRLCGRGMWYREGHPRMHARCRAKAPREGPWYIAYRDGQKWYVSPSGCTALRADHVPPDFRLETT